MAKPTRKQQTTDDLVRNWYERHDARGKDKFLKDPSFQTPRKSKPYLKPRKREGPWGPTVKG
jgi:hypothetical protein